MPALIRYYQILFGTKATKANDGICILRIHIPSALLAITVVYLFGIKLRSNGCRST